MYSWTSLISAAQHRSPLVFADASAAMQVRALKDYCNNYDLTSLNIKAGDIITVQRTNNLLMRVYLLKSCRYWRKYNVTVKYSSSYLGVCISELLLTLETLHQLFKKSKQPLFFNIDRLVINTLTQKFKYLDKKMSCGYMLVGILKC